MDERKKTLDAEKQKEIAIKRQRMREKEAHSVEVRRGVDEALDFRTNSIKDKRSKKEMSMMETAGQRQWKMMIRKEEFDIKRQDRLENIQRIGKASTYKNEMTLAKIEFDSMKS